MGEHESFAFCRLNPEWRWERTGEGDLVVMPLTGGWPGTRNFTLMGLFSGWVEADGTGLGEGKVYTYHPHAEASCLENPLTISGEAPLPGFTLDVQRL
jgi:hypothetical protein